MVMVRDLYSATHSAMVTDCAKETQRDSAKEIQTAMAKVIARETHSATEKD